MFVIAPTYPNYDQSKPDYYFKGVIQDINMDEFYNKILITGEYKITSNSYLPEDSYYLNMKCYFAEVTDIQLIFKEQISKKYIDGTSKVAYYEDVYTFSFWLNLNNSQEFKEPIYDRQIPFTFRPYFDQSILANYSVDYTNEILQKFIRDINNTNEIKNFNYSNIYKIYFGNNIINTNNLSMNENNIIKIFINRDEYFNNSHPLKNLFIIYNVTGKLHIIESNLKLLYKTEYLKEYEEIELAIENKIYNQDLININITDYYDYENNKLIKSSPKYGINGIYFPVNSFGKIIGKIKFEYQNKIRILDINIDFNFDKKNNDLLLSKIVNNKNYNYDFKNYNEVENEIIF